MANDERAGLTVVLLCQWLCVFGSGVKDSICIPSSFCSISDLHFVRMGFLIAKKRAGSQLLAINNYYQKRELAIAMIALVTLRLSFANELEWITSLDYYKVERHGISGKRISCACVVFIEQQMALRAFVPTPPVFDSRGVMVFHRTNIQLEHN
ncbi:hypothetical protein OUZ56_028454 [Daphnia magna]|uniref:Secreted protein n=1 Tax=Daphnia magna TaxID=35525 RepID=A0ABR0B3W7_9CRUS|nr:hypothetical protein OUZ56_028454 [Daphnia magna]